MDGATPRKRPLPIRIGGRSAATGVAEEEPLSPAAQLFHQPGFDCCIVAIMGLGKPVDVDVIRSGLEATLVRHPRFSSVPVLEEESGGAEPRWVRTEVVVDNHIVIPDLEDQRRTAASPDQVVEDYVASLTSAPMARSRPLWDLHILNFPTSDAAAVAVLRVHHSLGDGTSLMSLLLACTRKSSDPHSLPTIPHQSRRPLASRKLHAGGGAFTLLLWLWAFLILAWNTLLDVLRFTATSAFSKDTPTPLTGPKGVEYHPKRIVHRTVSLDDIKDVKNAMHCTVNDVLVGVTSAGLSRYLSRRYGQTVDEHGKKTQPPSNIRLRSTLLVNVRPIPGVHALAELMEGRDGGTKWGNYIGYVILPFSIFKYKDPMDYIRKAKEVAGRKKNSLEAIFTYKSGELIVKCFGIKAGAALCHRVLSNTTLSFSNMIGPVEEVAFYDHPIVYLAPSVYGHPQALTVHFQSYMNKMKMVVTVDDKVIPDAQQLLDDFAESIKLIKESIPTKP